jgi:polyisoprenyl-phosphate glycosyltransferase
LMADNEVILDMAEFSLISAHVRDAMVENDSTFPFLRTEIGYAGFRRVGIPYDRQMRISGHSHYNLFRMVTFAIGGILSSSTFLLRLAAYIVPMLIVANIVLGILFAWYDSALIFRLLVMLDLMYLLAFTSVISVYVARIYKDGVNRPIFIVDWQLSELGQPSHRPPRKMWTTHRKIRLPDAGTRSGNHVFAEGPH